MYNKLRSLIFKLDPEFAHNLALKALKINYFPQKKIEFNDSISTKICGKKIPNPIGMAAGFDKNAEVYNELFNLGFGFVEVGTITPKSQFGNSKPRVFRLEEDQALINRLGFNNSGAEKIHSRILSNSPKGLLGINIGPNKESKNRVEDYIICLRKFHDIADYITINISSPNTENLRNFHEENELDLLLNTIQNEKRKYYDFTKDYNGETYKYFLPDENLSHKAEMNEDPNERTNVIEYGKIRCKCGLGEAYEPQ